jgi:hypothetical protein
MSGRFLNGRDNPPRALTATLNRLTRWGNDHAALLHAPTLTAGEGVKREPYPSRSRVSHVRSV